MNTYKNNKDKIDSIETKCKPVILTGVEDYLKKKFTDDLLSDLSKAGKTESLSFDLSDIDFDHFRNLINVKSLMSTQKMIILSGDPKLLTKQFEIKKPKKSKRTYEEIILDCIANANQNVVLVINFDSLDKRKKLYKEVDKKGLLLEVKPLSEKDLIKFVVAYVKKQDSTIEPTVVKHLLSLVEHDLNLITSELNKLSSYCDNITIEVVDMLVSKSAKVIVFDLIDVISDGKSAKAVIMLNEAMSQGNSPFQVLTLLSMHYERLFYTKSFDKMKDGEVAKLLKTAPFFISKLRTQASKMSFTVIHKAMSSIVNTEIMLKTGYKDKVLLNLLISELCRGAKQNVRKHNRS